MMHKAAPDQESAELIEWRHRNAKRIDEAVKLLRPKSRDRCQDDVETALIEVEYLYRQLISGFEPTKLEKKAIKKLLPALRRVQLLMKDRDLPTEIELPLLGAVAQALERCEKIAAAPPAKNPRKKAELKKLTVREAAVLMRKHAGDSNNFVKLAKILYSTVTGDANVNLTSQVAAFLREARKAK
jgi:hypothetical protein